MYSGNQIVAAVSKMLIDKSISSFFCAMFPLEYYFFRFVPCLSTLPFILRRPLACKIPLRDAAETKLVPLPWHGGT